MSYRIGFATLLVLMTGSCEPRPWATSSQASVHDDVRVRAAGLMTDRYARSRFSGWNIRASAAGADCAVLYVETPIVLEDAMVEALHYGAGAYDVVEGGVQQFSRERTFRGVAYKDGTGRLWTYGAVTASEAEGMRQCH